MSIDFMWRKTMVLLVTTTTVKLLVWMGDLGCGQPISTRVCRMGAIDFTVMNKLASSALAAEDMKTGWFGRRWGLGRWVTGHCRIPIGICMHLCSYRLWYCWDMRRQNAHRAPCHWHKRWCHRLGMWRRSWAFGRWPLMLLLWRWLVRHRWRWGRQGACCLRLLRYTAGSQQCLGRAGNTCREAAGCFCI